MASRHSPRRSPPAWEMARRPSAGRASDRSVRTAPSRELGSPLSAASPSRRPTRRPADQIHADREVYFSTESRARGHRASGNALLAAAIQPEPDSPAADEGGEEGIPSVEQLDFTDELVWWVGSLFDDSESCDVVLRSSSGRAFHAHRAVLAGWSGELAARLGGSGREDHLDEDLPYEGDEAALESMLRAFYTGRIDVDGERGAVALLALCLAYDVRALRDTCVKLLDAKSRREHWWSDLQEELEALRGDGSMTDVWRVAEQLQQSQPETVADRRTRDAIRSGRLRINLRPELLRVVAALGDARTADKGSPGDLSDVVLSVPQGRGAAKEYRAHRGILSCWSDVLRKRLLQQRDEGYSDRMRRDCKLNLHFRLQSSDAREGDGRSEAKVVEQLLGLFYTGLLRLSDETNARQMLQAAVAFDIPPVELAARTWLMARGKEPGIEEVFSPPSVAEPARPATSTSTASSDDEEQDPSGPRSPHRSRLDEVYDELVGSPPSRHGLSLRDVEKAIHKIAPDVLDTAKGAGRGRGWFGAAKDHKVVFPEVADGSLDHGLTLYSAKGRHVIRAIRPGSRADQVPGLEEGMHLIKINGERVETPPGSVSDLLYRLLDEGRRVKLTVRTLANQRDWTQEDQRKALLWAYKAVDTEGDGWIGREQLEQLHLYLRYVYDNFSHIQQVEDKVGHELSVETFQKACSMIPHVYGTAEDFEKLCAASQDLQVVAADKASTKEFILWVIRDHAGLRRGLQARIETTHNCIFERHGRSGISFSRVRDKERSVDTIEVTSIEQGSDAEAQPGLRVGMILTSIQSPALSTAKPLSARFLDLLVGKDADAMAKLSSGAQKRIRQRQQLERTRLREACKETGLLAEGTYIGWDGLCCMGFDAVQNLLKHLFATKESVPITLGFAGGRKNLLFPGVQRCDVEFDRQIFRIKKKGNETATFRLAKGGYISLEGIDTALRCMFPSDAELLSEPTLSQKTIMSAYRAVDTRGDGCVSKVEFQQLVQFLVYFHNNWRDFEEMEELTEDRRQSFDEFQDCCQRMGEHLTREEAFAEFTEAQERQQHDTGARDDTIPFDAFCTWLARRARERMSSDGAEPHRVHEVSHSGAFGPRRDRLVMPHHERIRDVLSLPDAILEEKKLCACLSLQALQGAAVTLWPDAQKTRVDRVLECVRTAVIKPGADGERVYAESSTSNAARAFRPKDSLDVAERILRYTIVLDDIWDRVSQKVQHRQASRGESSTCGCTCGSRPAAGKIDVVIARRDFGQACEVAGRDWRQQKAELDQFTQDFDNSGEHFSLTDFCAWIVRMWIKEAGDEHGEDTWSEGDENGDSWPKTKKQFTKNEKKRLQRSPADPAMLDALLTMVDASLEVCQPHYDDITRHDFEQYKDVFKFLRGRCRAVIRLLKLTSLHDNKINLGDFRRCCDLVSHPINDVQVRREFCRFGVGPSGYIEARQFYAWFARQTIEQSLSAVHEELPVLVLPPATLQDSVVKALVTPDDRSLSLDLAQRAVSELLPKVRVFACCTSTSNFVACTVQCLTSRVLCSLLHTRIAKTSYAVLSKSWTRNNKRRSPRASSSGCLFTCPICSSGGRMYWHKGLTARTSCPCLLVWAPTKTRHATSLLGWTTQWTCRCNSVGGCWSKCA